MKNMYVTTNLEPFLIPIDGAQNATSGLIGNRDSVRLISTRIASNWKRASQTYISAYPNMGLFDTSKPSVVEINICKLSPGLRVLAPIPAYITIDEGECIASLRDAEVAISDASCTLAIAALREIIEHLFAKAQSGVKPGLAMKNTFAYLESHIVNEPE